MTLATFKLAFDRSSMRSIDANGFMHVAKSNISKACINPYYGREIPGYEALGLTPDKIYNLLRDPAELSAAADTFNNIPILKEHIPDSAADPQTDSRVGSTGTDAAFETPFLTNSLSVWDSDSIAGIESRDQCELSCAYSYVPDMTPGVFEGQQYDGVMREIQGNHVALVRNGRVGSEAIVSDSELEFSMKYPKTKLRKIHKALAPHLAQDATIGLEELREILTAADPAEDEEDDMEAKRTAALDAMRGCYDEETFSNIERLLSGNAQDEESDEDDAKAEDEDGDDDDDDKKAEDEGDDDKRDRGNAMDSATVTRLLAKAKHDAVAAVNALNAAKAAVEPHFGKVLALDSAEAVYGYALKRMGVSIKGVPASAYGSVFNAVKSSLSKKMPVIAQDSNDDDCPGMAMLKKIKGEK